MNNIKRRLIIMVTDILTEPDPPEYHLSVMKKIDNVISRLWNFTTKITQICVCKRLTFTRLTSPFSHLMVCWVQLAPLIKNIFWVKVEKGIWPTLNNMMLTINFDYKRLCNIKRRKSGLRVFNEHKLSQKNAILPQKHV